MGCKKKQPEKAVDAGPAETTARVEDAGPSGPRIVREEGPEPTADTVIASAGEHEVTLGDFERASRVSLLFAPSGETELPPEKLAIPHVHLTMTRALLAQELIAAEIARRGIEIEENELKKWVLGNEQLKRFGELWDEPEKLEAELAKLGLEPQDLRRVARAELQKERLADALTKDVTDDEIWETYQKQRTTRTLALVKAENVPTSDEIDEWMGDHPDEIEDYLAKNRKRFRTPKRVKLNIVKPAPGEDVSDQKLRKAAAMLRKGVQPVTIAKELGLTHELSAQLVRGENPEAFGMKPAEVGWTSQGPRGAYAWKVVGFEPSRPPKMTRALRREITAEILRTQQLVPSATESLKRAKERLGDAKLQPNDEAAMDALEKKIEAAGELEFSVVTFPYNPMGSIPKIGLAEEVMEAAFQEERQVGDVAGPLLSRERGFVFRVLDAHTATREEFEANLEANRRAYVDAYRPRAVQLWVEKKMKELGAEVDVKPLRIEFGVLQKE